MLSASKPSWQQVTALVSLSASGTVTGFSFVPHSPADLMSPTSMPVRLMALERSVQPAAPGDAALRSAIVNIASYYLRMAQGKTPPEMEAIIWQHDSVDGVDHGESCAAFASLTLELAAQVVGQQSWVTGGTSYPWPLHKWADVRVDPNPSSPNIISVLQDAEAHGRWHPLGDGYQPQPGDWVLFDNHVEVVTKYADATLYTIGGDSLPNFSVNAHEYPAPLAADGVVGFVNNGDLPTADALAASGTSGTATASKGGTAAAVAGSAAIPGATPAAAPVGGQSQPREHRPRSSTAAAAAHVSPAVPTIPGTPAAGAPAASTAGASDDAAIPGTPAPARGVAPPARHGPTAVRPAHGGHGGHEGPRGPAGGSGCHGCRCARDGRSFRANRRGARDDRGCRRHSWHGTARVRHALPAPSASAFHGAGSGHQRSAGVYRRGLFRGDSHSAEVRRPGGGDDRSGDRRVWVGSEPAGNPGQQPVRDQGRRPGGQRCAADTGVPERPVGDHQCGVPGVRRRRPEHQRSRRAARDQRVLHAGHGGPQQPGRVRQRTDRRLRDQSRLRQRPYPAHAAVRPVPLRRSGDGCGGGHCRPGQGRGGVGQAGATAFGPRAHADGLRLTGADSCAVSVAEPSPQADRNRPPRSIAHLDADAVHTSHARTVADAVHTSHARTSAHPEAGAVWIARSAGFKASATDVADAGTADVTDAATTDARTTHVADARTTHVADARTTHVADARTTHVADGTTAGVADARGRLGRGFGDPHGDGPWRAEAAEQARAARRTGGPA